VCIFYTNSKKKEGEGQLAARKVYGTNSISVLLRQAHLPTKERETHTHTNKEKEKGAIECGVREVCKVGNGL
jgi:hypothetical protein